MKSMKNVNNNKGFSLVELIVIIAIMAVVTGGAVLSISMATGSEARKVFQKIDAELNEVKTESMTRYGETLEIKYLDRSSLNTGSGATANNVNEKGFYGTKKVKTLTTGSGSNVVDEKSIGEENRLLGSERVTITLWYGPDKDNITPYELPSDGSGSIEFKYDRSNGLLKEVKITGETDPVVPQYLDCAYGMRTYRMEFIPGTGKHRVVK